MNAVDGGRSRQRVAEDGAQRADAASFGQGADRRRGLARRCAPPPTPPSPCCAAWLLQQREPLGRRHA